MNSMLLLEAVGYLDDDLLERSERPRIVNRRWIQWVAVAACICVVFVGAWGFLMPKKACDSAYEDNAGDLCTPQEPADGKLSMDSAIDVPECDEEFYHEDDSVTTGSTFGACYVLAGGETAQSYPQSFAIKDRQALEEYYAANRTYLEGSDFEEAMSKYDNLFFETKQLIVLVLEEQNPAVTHRVTDVYWDEDAHQWQVSIRRMIPLEKAQAEGISYWYILIEVDAAKTDENGKVRLQQTTYRETAQDEWTFVSVDE